MKGIGSQGAHAHLSGNHHDGGRVHHGIGHACEGIGYARSAGYQANAHLATHAGIALGSMCGGLFVAHQYMVKGFLFASCIIVKGIKNGHDGSARIAKDGGYPFGLERSHQRFGSCYLFHNQYLF